MADNNKHNLQYFEASSMRELYDCLRVWQEENQIRFHSVSIQNDGDVFSCIALTNPTEVVITSANGREHAIVEDGNLRVSTELS